MNNTSNISTSPFPIQFFYNSHCGSCKEAEEYLNGFMMKYPDMEVSYHDLHNSPTNNTLFDQYKAQFSNNSDIHYPVVFIGNTVIVGSADIGSWTESIATWYQKKIKTDLVTGFISWITTLTSRT
jgi:glutaredoxin